MLYVEYFHFMQNHQHYCTEGLEYGDNQSLFMLLWWKKWNVKIKQVKSHNIALILQFKLHKFANHCS
jgi:hypothetical protein